MRNVKVRFAPSPTGVPHVGNIRTALFNYFFAKATGGKFILRIEDTDQARKVEGAVRAIEESLSWLGVKWDKKTVQSMNLKAYTEAANVLISIGAADRENGAVRFKVPKEGSTFWVDAVGEKKIEFNNSEIEDFIILKSDGYPTYHLANVVDDHAQSISHVIRGEDWIPSTPKHILMYKAFGWEDKIPVFAHVPNVLGADGKKLSKRRGAKSVIDLKNEGFLPDALLNYLMLLGWSPKNDREILSREEIEKEFKLENINSSPAIFDEIKLLLIN
ncbi:MAG: glutamate--tRNA ligase [Candidatus Levybacteria bacterium]|nr:glutamate--tRNA ligase [Candidatus Levybacteria bacterium]